MEDDERRLVAMDLAKMYGVDESDALEFFNEVVQLVDKERVASKFQAIVKMKIPMGDVQ